MSVCPVSAQPKKAKLNKPDQDNLERNKLGQRIQTPPANKKNIGRFVKLLSHKSKSIVLDNYFHLTGFWKECGRGFWLWPYPLSIKQRDDESYSPQYAKPKHIHVSHATFCQSHRVGCLGDWDLLGEQPRDGRF